MDDYFSNMVINPKIPNTSSFSLFDAISKHQLPDSIKKIGDEDTFPCYTCANDRLQRQDCTTCNRKGILKGNHPMVRMIEQIIDSKLKLSEQSSNVGIKDLQYTLGSSLTRSITPEMIHDRYACDGCESNPICGKRYHCLVCNNYDLCARCFQRKEHPHEFRLEDGRRQTVNRKLDKETQRSLLMQHTQSSTISTRMSSFR